MATLGPRASQAKYQEIVANGGGIDQPSIAKQSAAKIYKHVLRRYRDEGLRVQREYEEIQASEGRFHGWYRRRNKRPFAALGLDSSSVEIVRRWREVAEYDLSGSESEIQAFERAA